MPSFLGARPSLGTDGLALVRELPRKGTTPPPHPYDGQLFLDTNTATPILRQYEASTDGWPVVTAVPRAHQLYSSLHSDVDQTTPEVVGSVLTYDADGKWRAKAPAGGGGSGETIVKLTADVTNANATANTLADVTGLSFPVVAGVQYVFKFWLRHTTAAVTTGVRWTLNGPAFSYLTYDTRAPSSNQAVQERPQSAYNSGVPATAANAGENYGSVEGMIRPTANGTVQLRFASEVGGSAVTVRAESFVEYRQI